MTALGPCDVPQLPRGVRLRFDEVRRAHVLLAPERAFHLDPVAVEILKRVDGQRSVDAIVDELAMLYDADRAVIAADVLALLADLAAKRVLATVAQPVAPAAEERLP